MVARVARSVVRTSKSRVERKRVNAKDAARPAARPAPASTAACRSTIDSTSRRSAEQQATRTRQPSIAPSHPEPPTGSFAVRSPLHVWLAPRQARVFREREAPEKHQTPGRRNRCHSGVKTDDRRQKSYNPPAVPAEPAAAPSTARRAAPLNSKTT